MSIKVKTVMIESPRAFQIFNDYYLSGSGALIEHSPIYTEFTAEVNISGSYTESYTAGTIVYDYSYTGSKTWTRIPIVGDSTAGMIKIGDYPGLIPINGVYETPEASVAQIGDRGSSNFFMGLRAALDKPSGPFEDPAPMYVPQYPAAVFSYNGSIETSAIIGTRTDNTLSPPVVTDIVEDIGAGISFNFLNPITDPRQIVDVMSIQGGSVPNFVAVINEDLTAWSPAKWRDFRGSYSATETNVNGITTTVDFTLG
jgi:hypothetical protein